MGASIIDGKRIADGIRAEVRIRVERLAARGTVHGLTAVLVGDNPASQLYVRMKGKACEEMGLAHWTITLPADISWPRLREEIGKLNADPKVHGILVQQPLPPQMPVADVVAAVDPRKDVDCFHPENVGLVLIGTPRFAPATPAGVVELLLRSGNDPGGKDVVIVGRSNIVGKPLAALLVQKARGANATVTVAHSGTRDLAAHTRRADILVSAMGSPRTITADMVRDGAVVIDVGTSRVPDPTMKQGYRTVGDVDFEPVKAKARAITPVPGGVGPMTIAMLLSNTVQAAESAEGVPRT
ncbi:MAG: bifunctional 5,10-methylene-tetrahydrofolate dehydrogenase/5,10-methylene-tetrahydrofolate cyclohydrolase [Euryarchaeota archaeon RBG_19FT_COMBO_69_17]|nr:MAG: bifunctional 5,10-methylene-tetrahydrofolate dehydrogenase/5,10-methylene-tetrahydrofolate cyclohydrolase [Euryarchaeota archaeon RBG_19FT_COMBO_69_17]